MGLSKKLGNVAQQRGLLPEYMSVEYKWSTQSYTIQDILRKFKLPCVVQCATDQCSITWSRFQFDFRYPLLLYSLRTVKKLHTRNLNSSTHEEFGPPMSIPEDYEGWFGATPKGVNQTKRHTRISSIANSNTLRFLVCSKCPAYTRSSGPNGSLDYVPRDILPGEVFKRICIMDGDIDDPDTPEIIRDNGPCLECLDEKDDDVLIPLTRRAMAYEISEFYPDANHKVFNVKSMVSAGNSKLPRIVSLVHGERPLLDYAFTGDLRCYSVFTEETILAATLDEASPMCLEMTTDSTAKFKLSLNEASVKRTYEYNNAFQLCKTSGDAFLTGIKVTFSVQPEPEGEENDMSVCDIQSTVSDMQETDANSEFEIAWSSEQNTSSSKSNYKMKAIEKGNKSMSDNFILLNNNSNQVAQNKTQIESKNGNELPVGESGGEDIPGPPSDFTEQEIADLMVRKGMIQRLGAYSSSDLNLTEEIETLRKARVKKNPIYFCDENKEVNNKDESKYSDPDYSVNNKDESKYSDPDYSVNNKDESKYSNPDYSDIDDVKSVSVLDQSDITEVSLDESEFGAAVCTKASEYHEPDNGSDADESEVELSGEVASGAIEEDSVHVTQNGDYDTTVDVKQEEGNKIESERGYLNYSDKTSLKDDDVSDNVQTVRRSVSSIIPSSEVEFLHGLDVPTKATSSEMMNKKKWWGQRKKGEGSSILQKFKSETNISKIFDKLKGSDDEKTKSSSKTKLLELKPSIKSSSKNISRNKTAVVVDDECFDVIEC